MDGRGYYVVDAETYQEVTADYEGSVYGDDEEEGIVVAVVPYYSIESLHPLLSRHIFFSLAIWC